MVEARTIIGIGILAGIGGAIWYFRDQLSALFAPPAECPAGWLLDVGSGQCCPEGFTYDEATGRCKRTSPETPTPTPYPVPVPQVVTPMPTYFTPQQIAAIEARQVIATPVPPTWIDVTETPAGQASPSILPPPEAMSIEEAGLTAQDIIEFRYKVTEIDGTPLTSEKVRIDYAGTTMKSFGMTYPDNNGIARIYGPPDTYDTKTYYCGTTADFKTCRLMSRAPVQFSRDFRQTSIMLAV